MAKQMRRVEKRYVPQQESYRSLPALSPQASPVDITPEPVVDPAASKLKGIAEGLSSLNKGLSEFFRMEKSFEETNRVANKVNAILGLPPVSGQGFLDYGVRAGYEEGKGLADSIQMRREMLQELEDNNYFVDPDDPAGTVTRVNKFTQDYINSRIPGQTTAYLEGAAKNLTEIKVEALSQAQARLMEARLQQQLSNESTIINETLQSWTPEIWGNPQALRENYNQMLRDGERRGMAKEAMGSLLLQVAEDVLMGQFAEAHDARDLQGSKENLEKLTALTQSAGLKDTAGQPLGAFRKTKDGRVERVLDSEISGLQGTLAKAVRAYEGLLKDTREKFTDDLVAEVFVGLSEGQFDTSRAREMIRPLAGVDSKTYNEAVKFIVQMERTQEYLDDSTLVRELMKSGDYTTGHLSFLMAEGRLSKRSARDLQGVLSNRQRDANEARRSSLHGLRMMNEERRGQSFQVAQSNQALALEHVELYGASPELNALVTRANGAGVQLTTGQMEALKVRREEDTRRKAEADAQVARLKGTVSAAAVVLDAEGSGLNPDQQAALKLRIKDVPLEKQSEVLSEISRKQNKSYENYQVTLQQIETKYPNAKTSGSALVNKLRQQKIAELKYQLDSPLVTPQARRLVIQQLSDLGNE